jgi:uncharacterized protein (TIGR00251 family)
MKIAALVKPNSKQERLEKINDNNFVLWVKAPAKDGRANEETVELLSEYLDIPKSRIAIIKGHRNRNKIICILEKA